MHSDWARDLKEATTALKAALGIGQRGPWPGHGANAHEPWWGLCEETPNSGQAGLRGGGDAGRGSPCQNTHPSPSSTAAGRFHSRASAAPSAGAGTFAVRAAAGASRCSTWGGGGWPAAAATGLATRVRCGGFLSRPGWPPFPGAGSSAAPSVMSGALASLHGTSSSGLPRNLPASSMASPSCRIGEGRSKGMTTPRREMLVGCRAYPAMLAGVEAAAERLWGWHRRRRRCSG